MKKLKKMQHILMNKQQTLEVNIDQISKLRSFKMSIEDYEVVIGLEIHAELSTKTKIFCNCSTEFGAEPNTHVCPVCMAMPGALPVLNEKVVEYAVNAG